MPAPTTTKRRTDAADDDAAPLIPYRTVPLFVLSAPIAVLHVDRTTPTSPLMLERFARHPRAVVARVDPTMIEATTDATLWLGYQQTALGWPRSISFPNGYYLFVYVKLISAPRKIGLFKVERPEIECWELEEYARILAAAKKEGAAIYAAVCRAGEAGLRVGEVKALRWREDVDLVARTLTVNQQMRRGVVGTPKGRTRRTVPMTATLFEALRAMSVVREGYVVLDHIGRGSEGRAMHEENVVKRLMERVCRKAGLPESGWHRLRHSFGTHAATFGANPWRLMTWMGHKRVDETMLYVHLAEQHRRAIPAMVLRAGARESDPDHRVLAMLGARCGVPWQECGNGEPWHARGNETEEPAEIVGISAG